MPLGVDMAGAEVGAEVKAGVPVGIGPGVGVGAGVHPETSLDVSSKREAAPALTVTVKAAGTDEAEAERGQAGSLRAAAGVAAEARAPVGVAAGARREARMSRGGAKSVESVKKVTRGGGS